MKQIIVGILLVMLIGVGGFVYRNAKERPTVALPMPAQQACTDEAKVCPDGTSVGRTGLDCAFAACAAPNAENTTLNIAYAVPAGFSANPAAAGTDKTIHAIYDSAAASSSQPDSIVIYSFPIPPGKTANDVILANTVHESSGVQAKSMSEFLPVITNGKTFQSITVERFEAIVHTEYYLARTNDVLRFDVLEHNVTNWSDTKLIVANLPAHAALLKMLATLQSTQ